MEENNIESANINFKWLDNIYSQLKAIQDMESLAKEGCSNLGEYLEIPFDVRKVLIPDIQYKNLHFLVLEMNSLIINLSPILLKKTDEYLDKLKKVIEIIDSKRLFLKETNRNNILISIDVLPLLNNTIKYLSEIKLGLIKDIGHILYIGDKEIKKTW